MRITIDTDLQAIIVPETYYAQVDRLNEIIADAGGVPLDYTGYIKTCFEKAFHSQIVKQSDLSILRNAKKSKPAVKKNKSSDP